jgi:hypothetical protein
MNVDTWMAAVEPIPEGRGCWEWMGFIRPSGYGQVHQNKLAHRVSWELHNGPIPNGVLVLHKCDNKSCVNPDHLFLGSHRDNTQDMMSKGRGNVRALHCRRGHDLTGENRLTNRKPNGIMAHVCRICRYEYNKAYKARIKAASNG